VAEPDRQALLTALTTEHFGLAGARAQTTGESSSRAALYISAVSSTLVALGFIGQITEVGDAFDVFALTALPTLYVLGLFTFIRVVENGVEDLMLGRAINRIRNYYLELAGEHRRYFMLSGHDDAVGVMQNMGVALERRQQFFTTGAMVAVINSVVGGAAIAIAVGAFTDAPLGLCAALGGLAAIISQVLLMRIENRMYHEMGGFTETLFPSPESASEE
jgi:hypothetical protein